VSGGGSLEAERGGAAPEGSPVDSTSTRTVALIGPGRAGTTIALALSGRGWEITAVAGRAPDARSTLTAAACLDVPAVLVSEAGTGASLVVIATPDAAIEAAARSVAPSVEAGALVIHLSGAQGLGVFASMLDKRPDIRVGALHPLQSFPSVSTGLARLPGAWAAVTGDPEVRDLALLLDLRPFDLPDAERVRYHATAVVASNHLVALIGQVQRMAAACGVPFEAFAPLALASLENAFRLGPAAALTGPVARGDLQTIEKHIAEMAPAERDAYRALAREAARLVEKRDSALSRLLGDVLGAERTTDGGAASAGD